MIIISVYYRGNVYIYSFRSFLFFFIDLVKHMSIMVCSYQGLGEYFLKGLISSHLGEYNIQGISLLQGVNPCQTTQTSTCPSLPGAGDPG